MQNYFIPVLLDAFIKMSVSFFNLLVESYLFIMFSYKVTNSIKLFVYFIFQDEVCGMIEWLNSLTFYVKTAYDSIDCSNLKELIIRTLCDWRLIMQQLKESENTSLDNVLSEESDNED